MSLYAADRSGAAAVVDVLLAAGPDVNKASHHGPPLSRVAYVPDDLVARLLAHGVSVGETSHAEIARLLQDGH